jgi:protein tyrosine phosphatase (PTP) superfamily phosphohydrolase (DUF442 family)
MSIDQAYNYRAIDIGFSTAGVLTVEQLQALHTEGYQALINLLPDSSEHAVAGERAIVEAQGIDYRHIPVDFAAPIAADYRAFAAAMNSLMGKKILAHCAANYRVSAFYAIYAHQHLGWSVARALEFVDSIWQPAEYPQWQSFLRNYLKS